MVKCHLCDYECDSISGVLNHYDIEHMFVSDSKTVRTHQDGPKSDKNSAIKKHK